jgi:UDP-2,3-diacylglucosamine pyrophosphatase LpxH
MMSFPESRSVYVISDLHLGGDYGKTDLARGFRINTHVRELSEFVTNLARRPVSRPLELVINGDMVDFLAEREARADPSGSEWAPFTIDAGRACDKLHAIAARDPDRTFFAALRGLLDAGHRLVILPGNHDIELELPAVRRKLRQVIGVKPGHDYEFINAGEAYIVGDALIEHGNRYDKWNQVNHDQLRRISSLQSRLQPIPDGIHFDPPPGSKMVAWVINPIKQDYQFIDLIKPEADVAVPLLLALEPGYRRILATVAKLALEVRSQGMRTAAVPRRVSDINKSAGDRVFHVKDIGSFPTEMGETFDEEDGEGGEEDALEQVLNRCLDGGGSAFLDSVGLTAESASGAANVRSIGQRVDRTWSLAQLLLARDDADVGKRLPALLMALRALEKDRSFDLEHDGPNSYTRAADELMVKGNLKYAVFGHTHLAKKVELGPGRWYLNSGTWSDLIQLPQEILAGTESEARAKLEPFLLAISSGSLQPWIRFRPTYVRLDIDESDQVVGAELCHYSLMTSADK